MENIDYKELIEDIKQTDWSDVTLEMFIKHYRDYQSKNKNEFVRDFFIDLFDIDINEMPTKTVLEILSAASFLYKLPEIPDTPDVIEYNGIRIKVNADIQNWQFARYMTYNVHIEYFNNIYDRLPYIAAHIFEYEKDGIFSLEEDYLSKDNIDFILSMPISIVYPLCFFLYERISNLNRLLHEYSDLMKSAEMIQKTMGIELTPEQNDLLNLLANLNTQISLN